MDINELESFNLSDAVSFHEELNPQLWEDHKLDPEVRDQLLLIAEDFVEYLGLSNLKVEDVTISGSNAAYSYTPHSDLDLHVLVDFSKLPDDPVYQELFTAKKTLYNDAHDITVHDVPVELYVQDINQPVQSLGEYSIVHDKWIRIPKKRRANFDEAATKAKYEKLGDLIELALKSQDPKRVDDTTKLIKRYRKSGLDKTGEFGPENLAYKAVRKQGLVKELYDLKTKLHAEKLSIEEEHKILNKPTLSVAELAEKHGVSRADIAKQLDKGIKVELEHTSDRNVAKEIASDHIAEDPKYYDKLASVELEEAPRTFQSQSNPIEKLIQAYSYFTTLGNVHLDKQGETPEAQQQLLALVQRLNKDGKVFAGLDKNKIEANRDTILKHVHQMMNYAIPVLKKYLPSDAWEAKRNQVNSVLQAYNDARQINEEQLDETAQESQLVNLISKNAANIIVKMLRKKESQLANIIAPDIKRQRLETWGISAEQLGVPYTNDPVLSKVLSHSKFTVVDRINPINPGTLASYDSRTHDIMVYYPTIVRYTEKSGYQLADLLAKTIAHELQHAVDNFKSQGKALNMRGAYSTRPHEINARFQEALMNMSMEFDRARKEGKTLDRKHLPRFVDSSLEHNEISQFLPKDGARYKQLAKRAYKFFDAELNNPKKEQPLNFAKRALNFFLDKPTKKIAEASGYIPSEKEKNDPRFKTALTVDVKPDAIKKNAKAFNWKTSRAGIPPESRTDGKISEALISYSANKKFVNETEEIQYVATTIKDWRIRRKIFETITARNINESTDNYQDIRVRVMKSLGEFSSRNLKIGNKYIPVQINILRDSLLFYDVKGNVPAQEPAKFGTLVELSSDEAKIRIDDQVYNYPIHIDSANLMMVTVFLDSEEKYDQFRMMVSLEFDQSLPSLITTDDLTESLFNEWESFLVEDEEQQELFPGYDEQHREKRLDAWLKNTYAWHGNKPQVFYHATDKDFDTIRTSGKGKSSALGMTFEVDRHGAFFAVDPKFAEWYAEDPDTGEWKPGARVIPVYLSIQNPFDLRDNNLSNILSNEDAEQMFLDNGINLRSVYNYISEYDRWELFDGEDGAEFVQNLKKMGYDGAIMNEMIPNNTNAKSGEVWVIFDPNQAKAIHNRGSFSPDDPRLMKENG